jgi:hypothetical protein
MLYPVELQAQTLPQDERLVGAEGFELSTSSSQSWRSTRLSYTPTFETIVRDREAFKC